MPEKIVLDCDPGIDDAIAIITALKSSSIDLKGITTVSGSSTVSTTALNACRILDFLEVSDEFPVVKGASNPLYASRKDAGEFHGRDGMGDSNILPKSSNRKLDSNTVEFILSSIKNQEVKKIVATGPLTNIAKALKKDPKTMSKLETLVIMGGAIKTYGNIDRMSEFNFYADPDAADYVLNNFNNEKFLFPVDVTRKVIFTKKKLNKIKNTDSGKLVKSLLESYRRTYVNLGYGGCPIHDALTLSYLINSSQFRLRDMDLRVETRGKFTRGTCVPELRRRAEVNPNVKVAVDAKRKIFKKILEDILSK